MSASEGFFCEASAGVLMSSRALCLLPAAQCRHLLPVVSLSHFVQIQVPAGHVNSPSRQSECWDLIDNDCGRPPSAVVVLCTLHRFWAALVPFQAVATGKCNSILVLFRFLSFILKYPGLCLAAKAESECCVPTANSRYLCA